jgi:trimethylamine:corrinoid methyltransferase-like protein
MTTGAPTLLDALGATLLSVGANMIYAPAGWIVGGLAVLALNRQMHGD